jgi:FdhD protein
MEQHPGIEPIQILKYKERKIHSYDDTISIEEPLEISLVYYLDGKKTKKNISITMRTPGKDRELAAGFLFTEGILSQPDSIEKISQFTPNEISIHLKENSAIDLSKIERHFYTSSSCGVCGKSSIDAIRVVKKQTTSSAPFKVSTDILLKLDAQVRNRQSVFESTGGLHASALFDTEGQFKYLFEDVGRHNALDKLIGFALLNNEIPLHQQLLFLSGRASFELIQKAAMAEIPIVCALGAPSSLAVSLAKEFNITLVGFLKSQSFNIYHDTGILFCP